MKRIDSNTWKANIKGQIYYIQAVDFNEALCKAWEILKGGINDYTRGGKDAWNINATI